MAEINFGLIDTQAPARIANALMPSPEQQGAQALQVMQMQQAARQGQVSQMQFQKMKRENDMLETIRAKIIANGGPPDLRVAARAMIESGDPEHILMGQKIETSVRQQEEATQYRRDNNVNVPVANNLGAPTATMPPMTGAPAATMPPMTGVPTATMPPMTGAPASTGGNALTGMVTPPAVPPVVANNLVPGSDPSAPLKTKLDWLIRNYHRIGNNPELQSEKALLLKQIEDVQHSLRDLSVLPPDVKLMQALGIPATQAGFAQLTALKDNPGEFTRILNALDLPPDEKRALQLQKVRTMATHTPGTKVILPPMENAEQKGKGEANVKLYGDISAAARLAAKSLPAIETQGNIINRADFATGFGTDVKKAGASLLAALGVPEAERFATNAQTFLAASQQAVLQRQLEQKGPQTEADAQRITQTGAQLGNTPAANKFIIDVAKSQFKRDMEQRNFFDNWWKTNKTYEGAETAWYAGDGGKSLFDRADLKKYTPKTPAAAQGKFIYLGPEKGK